MEPLRIGATGSGSGGPASGDPGAPTKRDRRTFNILAGLAGFLFLSILIIVPFLLFVFTTISFPILEPGRRDWPHVWDAVYWEGSLWYIQESIPRRMSPRQEATLQKLDPKGKGEPETVASLFMEEPYLLPGTDRLWIVSPEDVRYMKGGRETVVNVGWRLGDISAPFLVDGNPAVLEQRPAGVTLSILHHDHWERGDLIHLEAFGAESLSASAIRVVPCGGAFHLFMERGSTLYHREGIPGTGAGGDEAWEPVATSRTQWAAECVEREPVVFMVQSDSFRDTLVNYRKSDRGWSSQGQVPLRSWRSYIGVVPLAGGPDLLIVSAGDRGSVGVCLLRNGEIKGPGKSFASAQGALTAQVLRLLLTIGVGLLVLPLLAAFLLSAMMARWLDDRYDVGSASAKLASLWRRVLAGMIDLLILGSPVLSSLWLLTHPLIFPGGGIPASPFPAMILIVAGVLWSAAGFVAFCVLEGKRCATPGKWIMGIRVLGTDLLPCGVPRALIRNLLRCVDAFLDGMMGIFLAALSEKRQRVGDMAARTVVVRRSSQSSSRANTQRDEDPSPVGQAPPA
jgi:uncharacterized RDD family membrane protein YckC